MKIEQNSPLIKTLEDWECYAGPKKKKQWKPGRSAYETARAWLRSGEPAMPEEIKGLLDSSPMTKGLEVEAVAPEYRIRFDDYRGEPRNADLAFTGLAGDRKVAITVEAKADESFGDVLSGQMKKALEAKRKSEKSRRVERIEDLAEGLFGLQPGNFAEVESLRYQLLTAAAGTLAYAKQESAEIAVLIVHVFRTEETEDEKIVRNDQDYQAFVKRLHELSPNAEGSGDLAGPFAVPGAGRFEDPVPLYMGKVLTDQIP